MHACTILHAPDETDALVTRANNNLGLGKASSRGLTACGRRRDRDTVHDTSVALGLGDKGARTDIPGLERAVGTCARDEVDSGGGVGSERRDGFLRS